MKKLPALSAACLLMLFTFSGCGPIGDKTANLSVIYIATTVIAFAILIIYCCIIKKRDLWFLLLFSMVCVVNLGYLALSLSATLEEALLANRISYLGSVFLPLSMLFIILNVCRYRYGKWLPIALGFLSVVMFLIAASPGYSDIYYKEVILGTAGGVTVLDKVYGDWHPLYLFYLIFYFGAMIVCTSYAAAKKKISTTRQAVVVTVAVMVNIGVWLIEQLVKIDFEFLSVSYIISEMFLLSLCFMLQDEQKSSTVSADKTDLSADAEEEKAASSEIRTDEQDEAFLMQCELFAEQIKALTPTEKAVFSLYLDGKSTKEIMSELNIKENTLKYHNKNIYGKLGVSSRKQMLELASKVKIKL
ncbi:MAG: hypothetical protein E7543_09510 [Ruminococcaceae bacterium]|nr:hypothetical protein [Oscillospiraceae bacterium]